MDVRSDAKRFKLSHTYVMTVASGSAMVVVALVPSPLLGKAKVGGGQDTKICGMPMNKLKRASHLAQ